MSTVSRPCCKGLLVLFWGFQVVMYCSFGSWWLGPLAVALQWGLLWCLRWGLRWLGRWATRACGGVSITPSVAVQTWRREHRR